MNIAYIMGAVYRLKSGNTPYIVRYYCFKRNLSGKKREDYKKLCPLLEKLDYEGGELVAPIFFKRIPWRNRDASLLFEASVPANIREFRFTAGEVRKNIRKYFMHGATDWRLLQDWTDSHPEVTTFPEWCERPHKECKREIWLLLGVAFRQSEQSSLVRFFLFNGANDIVQRVEARTKSYVEECYGIVFIVGLHETLEDRNEVWTDDVEYLPQGKWYFNFVPNQIWKGVSR